MRDILGDIVRQSAGLFETLKITGSETETLIQATDKDKSLFLSGVLNAPAEPFKGSFGIGNLGMLGGLLRHPSYRAETATFTVGRAVKQGEETVTHFDFRDANGQGAVFRTMAAAMTGEQPVIKAIPWDAEFAPCAARITEFKELVKLYSDVDTLFGVHTENGALLFHIGDDSDARHSVSMVFEPGVNASINGGFRYNTAQFLAVVRQCAGTPTQFRIINRGVLGIGVVTDYGRYDYYLRAKV